MDTAELSRRMESQIRLGTIAEVDHAAARCRVQTGGLLTDWLPWMAVRAGATRQWSPPSVGEQALLLSPSGHTGAGIVIPGLYADAHAAPSASPDEHVTDYPDGARIAYNHATGALIATGIKTAQVQAAESVTLDTPQTHITGELVVDGLITYRAGMSGVAGEGGSAITIEGPLIQTGGPLSSNGIVLDTHHHTGVTPGGGETGDPT